MNFVPDSLLMNLKVFATHLTFTPVLKSFMYHTYTDHRPKRSLVVVQIPVAEMTVTALLLIFSASAALGHQSDKDPGHIHSAVRAVWLPAVRGAPSSHL